MAGRTGRVMRIALIAVVAVLVLAIGAGAVFLATFDPNSQKPRIIAAVRDATGRELTLNGPIHLKWSLQPTLTVSDVSLANPPGFSRPQMASLQSVDLQLAILPLLSHRIEIQQLVLVRPDIQLEVNAKGEPNWQFSPPAAAAPQAHSANPASAPPPNPSQPPRQTGAQPRNQPQPPGQTGAQPPQAATGQGNTADKAGTTLDVQQVRIRDGVIAYRDDRAKTTTSLAIASLAMDAKSPNAPLHLSLDATYNGTQFTLTGDTGSLARLQDGAAQSPWPVKLTLQSNGARVGVDGTLTRPLQGAGYQLAVTGSIPDLAALAPLLPGVTLPPLHDLNLAGDIADQGGKLPAISRLTLRSGAGDLGQYAKGLTLQSVDIQAPAPDQPVHATAVVQLNGTPVQVTANLGSPQALLAGGRALPVDVTLQAAGATASAQGQIADAAALSGVNLALAVQVPDATALAPLLGTTPPPLKSIELHATLKDTGKGLQQGAELQQIKLQTPQGDVTGHATLALAGRPNVTAELASSRLDIDALAAATGKPTTPEAAASSAPPPQVAPPPRQGEQYVFSRQKIDYAALQQADADLTWSAAALHMGGNDYKSVQAHVVLRQGKLTIERLTAALPTGQLSVTASVDGAAPAHPVALTAKVPGLPLQVLLAALNSPAYASGNLEVYADLKGAGDSLHAIAASLDGSLGVALAGGTIDNRLLGATLGKVLEAVNALDLVGRGGTSQLRCFASRLDLRDGIGSFRTLALSSSMLTMTGGGTVNLGAETVGLLLRPQARVAGNGLVVPVRVVGPLLSPSAKVDPGAAAEANAGSIAGAVIGNATPLGLLGGLLGADKVMGNDADACAGPLALARGEAPPAHAATPAPAPTPKPTPNNPGNLLRQLFR